MGTIKNPQRMLQREDQTTIPIRTFKFIFFNCPFPYKGVARLSLTARIERPPLYRGGSASKKDGLAAPFSSF